jgi:hypothetical protein
MCHRPQKKSLCACVCCCVQRVLSAYAGELLKRLPKTAAGGTSAQPPYSGTEWHVRLPDEEEGVLCSILATAEYCRWGSLVRLAGWDGYHAYLSCGQCSPRLLC